MFSSHYIDLYVMLKLRSSGTEIVSKKSIPNLRSLPILNLYTLWFHFQAMRVSSNDVDPVQRAFRGILIRVYVVCTHLNLFCSVVYKHMLLYSMSMYSCTYIFVMLLITTHWSRNLSEDFDPGLHSWRILNLYTLCFFFWSSFFGYACVFKRRGSGPESLTRNSGPSLRGLHTHVLLSKYSTRQQNLVSHLYKILLLA